MGRFIIVLCIVLLFSCESSSNTSREAKNYDSSRVNIVDVFQDSPYKVKEHKKLTAPDSLFDEGVTGSVVFAYTLDSEGEIDQVDVMKLRLRNSRGDLITDFFDSDIRMHKRQKKYPDSVKVHLPWLLSYAKNLEFQVREDVNVKGKTRFTLPTKVEK